jgi:hypothetical protein
LQQLSTAGHAGINACGEFDLCERMATETHKPSRGSRNS